MFCGPETAVVARGEAEGNNSGRGATKLEIEQSSWTWYGGSPRTTFVNLVRGNFADRTMDRALLTQA